MNASTIRIIDIRPGTPETRGNDPARFVIRGDGRRASIDTYGPSFGWICQRYDIGPEDLAQHLDQMRAEGFIVTETTIDPL
jgi:hypothetical protein